MAYLRKYYGSCDVFGHIKVFCIVMTDMVFFLGYEKVKIHPFLSPKKVEAARGLKTLGLGSKWHISEIIMDCATYSDI